MYSQPVTIANETPLFQDGPFAQFFCDKSQLIVHYPLLN